MSKRNFQNRYYAKLGDHIAKPYKVGHAVTLGGAVKAAFKRVLDREYDKAIVYDPIGGLQFIIRRINNKVVSVTNGY